MIVKINLDRHEYSSKPGKQDISGIQARLAQGQTEIEVEELAQLLGRGCSFKPALLSGSKNDTWQSQQVFALDFDNGKETLEGILKRCEIMRIKPAFAYRTFSHTEECPRFRLVFICDVEITDIRVRNIIQSILLDIFQKSDQSTKDAARLFFGGKELVKVDYNNTFNPYWLIQYRIMIFRFGSPKHFKEKIRNFCESFGVNMINDLPDIRLVPENEDTENGENLMTSILYIYRAHQKFSEKQYIKFNFNPNFQACTIPSKGAKTQKIKVDNIKIKFKPIQGFDFEQLEKKCRLYQGFIGGTKWCYHKEVFGMATNLYRVIGAEAKMIKAISDEKYKENYNNLYNTIKCVKAYNYAPESCKNFCPYFENCKNGGYNMIDVLNNKRGTIRKLDTVADEYRDVDEAGEELSEELQRVFEAKDNKVYIIKAATGLGKTMAIASLGNLSNTCIAYPNHRLGNETFERLDIKGAIHVCELKLQDAEKQEQFRKLQSIGDFTESKKFLEGEFARLQQAGKRDEARQISVYLGSIDEARTTSNAIFCTHKRALDLHNKNINTYIFDEDVLLSTLMQTVNVEANKVLTLERIAQIEQCICTETALKTLHDAIVASQGLVGQVVPIPTTIIKEQEIKKILKNNREKILETGYNLRDILCIQGVTANRFGDVLGIIRNELPKRKCIIMSATVNQKIYEDVLNAGLPDNEKREVEFIDLGNVSTLGKLYMHYVGFSRTALKKDFSKAIEKIKKESPDIKNVITFAKFEKQFQDAGYNTIAHFGACQGIDAYSGQNIAVVGTPYCDERVYLLFAHVIAPNAIIKDSMKYCDVERNGFEFYIQTYNAEELTPSAELLREIEFYLIENELLQAVGRARLLRNDCEVHVYSSLPLRGSILYQEK